MATPGQQPIRFNPRGVSDTVDGDNSQPGACTSLTNLIQAPDTPNCFVCRPANTQLIDFANMPGANGVVGSAGTPGVVVTAAQVGGIIYGLVGITAGTYNLHDFPFAFNTLTGAFVVITGITVPKTPISQATAGAWVPPQMSLTGIDMVVTHTGFPGGGGAYFGYFNITNVAAPTWDAVNTTTNGLPSVPQGVGTFNNRTYFACGNLLYYTDTLALAMTNANQSVSAGDYTSITCVAPLPVGTTSQAIIQGLLLFKINQVYLLTGDAVTSDLGLNLLSPSVGTTAPRSVVPTPEGVKFMAVDGLRNISFFGVVSEPDGDIAVPFINAVIPSRVAAAFNADTYRICVQNGIAVGSPYQDYWYNFRRKSWTGPHTFRYDLAVPLSSDFALASNAIIAKMWNGFAVQGRAGLGTTFIENSVQLTWVYTTSPMTALENIYANKADRTTIKLGLPASGQTYNFIAQNESGTNLAQGTITQGSTAAVWGQFTWGFANWGAAQSGLIPYTVPWDQTVVFNELSIMTSGASSLGAKMGSIQIGYKRLNYLLN